VSADPLLTFALRPVIGGLVGFVLQSWSRLSEQNLRLDKWSICQG